MDAKSNKILMFDCLLLLGDELGSYYDEKMQELQEAIGSALLHNRGVTTT